MKYEIISIDVAFFFPAKIRLSQKIKDAPQRAQRTQR